MKWGKLAPVRAAIIVLLVVAMLWAWSRYRYERWLQVGFGTYLGDILPTYADERITPLWMVYDTDGRLADAAVIWTVSLALLMTALFRRWRTSLCLLIALIATLAINVSVARIPAAQRGVYAPFGRLPLEYFGDVRYVRDDSIRFIEQYPRGNRFPYYRMSHHAGTHPPGGVLFLWAGGKAFGPSLEAACWLAIVVTALGVLPAYVLARTLGGAAAARRLLPLYVSAPNLVLLGATCMDGVFMTFALAAMAACFIAMRRWSFAWPIVAGMLLWVAAFMTYAVVAIPLLMGCHALVVAVRRPGEALRMIARATLVGIVFIACQLAAERWLHYDFRACVESAMQTDLSGVYVTGYESLEIWRSHSLGNLLAFTFGSGLAAAALFFIALVTCRALRKRSPRRLRTFVPAVAMCVIVLACSTLFSLEVERVWMFLTPAALTAATLVYRGTLVWILVPALLITQALYIEWNFNTWW